MKKIVIIPSYNEEKNIGKVIRGIRKNHRNLDVLVINDCSDDKTEEIAKYENAYVVNHVLRAGYGVSLQTGYKYTLHKNYNIVIQLDGDGQHDPEHISAFILARNNRSSIPGLKGIIRRKSMSTTNME